MILKEEKDEPVHAAEIVHPSHPANTSQTEKAQVILNQVVQHVVGENPSVVVQNQKSQKGQKSQREIGVKDGDERNTAMKLLHKGNVDCN